MDEPTMKNPQERHTAAGQRPRRLLKQAKHPSKQQQQSIRQRERYGKVSARKK
jgi:hypothetical protein